MKKIIAALFFALLFVTAGSALADVLDDNPKKFYHQATNNEGNSFFIVLDSVHHLNGNLTSYVGITRLSNRSNLFIKAKQIVGPTEVPLYVTSAMTVDCTRGRLKTGAIGITGVDTADPSPVTKTLWIDEDSSTEWTVIPNGIEPNARAILCGPSF